jgi:glucose/arabinose dehydrogenase
MDCSVIFLKEKMRMRMKLKVGQPMLRAVAPLAIFALAVCGQTGKTDKPKISASAPPSRERIIIKADALPQPFETNAAMNPPRVVPQPAGAVLKAPPGFEVKVFAEGEFRNPRWIIEGPNGDLFVSDARANNIVLLRDQNKDGAIDNASERFLFVEGLTQPFGMAIHNGYFYVANTNAVVRFRYQTGQTKLEGAPEKVTDLPGLGYRQHWTRNLIFRPDGKKMYVSVGSETNVSEEADPRRAAISEYNPDGSGHRIFASGIRNPIGLAWHPTTGALWTAVNERDGLGDDLVPDYVTSVKDGGFYGWPYAYLGPHEEPRLKGKRPDLVARTLVPDVLVEAHSAALGIIFYTGKMFPKEYQGNAFVALHGSWNRALRSGYKIIHIPFKQGKPEGGYENFITGWVLDDASKDVWGRPVGLTMIRDGSLLIVDDGGNKIWRVSYKK